MSRSSYSIENCPNEATDASIFLWSPFTLYCVISDNLSSDIFFKFSILLSSCVSSYFKINTRQITWYYDVFDLLTGT